jgi:mono/diheme cytochrome c family protein
MMNIRSKVGSLKIGLAVAALLALGVVVGARGANTPSVSAKKAVNGDMVSVVRGGRLYDDWFGEISAPMLLTPHPAYPASGKFVNDPKTTWRCKECHGYDYLGNQGAFASGDHFTGIKGIRGMIGAPLPRVIAILKDQTHQYDKVMIEQDLLDLARFVSHGQVDMAKYIDPDMKAVKGDTEKGQVLFNTICANCHGYDGQKIRKHRAIGHIARINPWKAFHEILNGHPGETMPPLRVFGEDIVVGILGYAQSLPTEQTLTSIVRGGRLYDNWYMETGKMPPVDPHPAYPAESPFAKNIGESWRCVRCHGWDYRGQAGAYGKGSYYTGIQGIRNAVGMSPEAIVSVLKDRTHGYAALLTDVDLRDLANFVSEGQVDTDRFIDRRTGAALGDSNRHVAFYTTICARCHGTDGREISNIRTVGKVAVTNPQMTLHMILNGHPAEEMPALRALDPDILADILAYIQTLPTER